VYPFSTPLRVPGETPRTSPGNSVVVVAPLPEGVTWYEVLRNARLVVVHRRRAQRLRVTLVLSICHCWLSFLFLSLLFRFGLDCAAAQQLYRVVAIII